MDTSAIRQRITDTRVFGPALADQLLREFDNLDPEKMTWLARLLDEAEATFQKFGESSKEFIRAIDEIENGLLDRVREEAVSILGEFEEELARLKA